MKIVITGQSGVGKTTILKKIKYRNTIFIDEVVKTIFYKKGHPLFDLVVRTYGKEIVVNSFIDTSLLAQKVLTNPKQLTKLSKFVNPFIKEYIQNLQGDYIMEMATYINYEKDFKDVFDKVILITRDHDLAVPKHNTIKNKKIDYDLLVENSGEVSDAAEVLKLILQNTYLKNI